MINIPKYSTYVFPGSPVNGEIYQDPGTEFVFKYIESELLWALQVHGFIPTTLESTGVIEYVLPQADEEFFIHADTTPKLPDTPAANKIKVYVETMYTWEEVWDYRSTNAWYQADGTVVTFTLGMDFNDTTMTLVAPPNDYNNGYYVYNATTDVWDYDLDATRLFQKRKISKDASVNLESVLTPGLDSVYDLIAWSFARMDAFNYGELVPTPNATINSNVALSGTLPNPNSLVDNDVVKLTGQTDPTQNGYYDYQETGPNYTLTPIVFPETPFYGGAASENGLSIMQTHEWWNNPAGGAANYFGIFAERKKITVDAIDAATTGPAILAVTWTPF